MNGMIVHIKIAVRPYVKKMAGFDHFLKIDFENQNLEIICPSGSTI